MGWHRLWWPATGRSGGPFRLVLAKRLQAGRCLYHPAKARGCGHDDPSAGHRNSLTRRPPPAHRTMLPLNALFQSNSEDTATSQPSIHPSIHSPIYGNPAKSGTIIQHRRLTSPSSSSCGVFTLLATSRTSAPGPLTTNRHYPCLPRAERQCPSSQLSLPSTSARSGLSRPSQPCPRASVPILPVPGFSPTVTNTVHNHTVTRQFNLVRV